MLLHPCACACVRVRVCVCAYVPSQNVLHVCSPFFFLVAPIQPRQAVDEPSTTKRASARAGTEFGTRLRAFWTAPSFDIECLASSVYSPFALLIRGGASLSAPQCKQCNAIGLHLHFHHPISRTARPSGLLLRFSCASPASPHLPAHLSNVSPFSSVPRLAHFAREGQPVPRHAAISRLSHARPFSTLPHEHPRP